MAVDAGWSKRGRGEKKAEVVLKSEEERMKLKREEEDEVEERG